MEKMRKKKDLKKGDKIYIVKSGLMNRGEAKLEEYEIVKINSSSLYIDFSGSLVRISLRDLKGKLSLTHFQAYLNKEDFYKPLKNEKEKKKEIEEIYNILNNNKFNLKELKEIKKYIKNI